MTTHAKPPLTRKKHGSTRCVGCSRLFTATPEMAVVETEATDFVGGRRFYSANTPIQVTRRWHADCLADFERANEEYRAMCEADRQEMADILRAEMAKREKS